MGYLIFDKPGKFEYGYKPFKLTPESIKANQGKQIVYLTKRDIDKHRGIAFPRFGTIGVKKYSTMYFHDYSDSINIRDIIECGIKIDSTI
jgi:hypothetical protein